MTTDIKKTVRLKQLKEWDVDDKAVDGERKTLVYLSQGSEKWMRVRFYKSVNKHFFNEEDFNALSPADQKAFQKNYPHLFYTSN